MRTKRTDLAVEAKEIWREGAERQTELPGVEARDRVTEGFHVTTVKILNEEGERELQKPVGTYVTIELDAFIKREDAAFNRGVAAVSREISDLLKIEKDQRVLVVGLGNGAITPDAIGPKTARHTMVTWHLVDRIPEHFGSMRRVSVLESGVLGTTGIESSDVIRAITEQIRPDKIIAIDALASRKLSRVCRTIQLADTGIVPGSGVYNDRRAINAETLGVPVLALGVPTVVEAGTLAADLMGQAEQKEIKPSDFQEYGGSMIVTPKEIDAYVGDVSKLLGYGINLALHQDITIDDINLFLS